MHDFNTRVTVSQSFISNFSTHHYMQGVMQLCASLGYCIGPPLGGGLLEVREFNKREWGSSGIQLRLVGNAASFGCLPLFHLGVL